MELKNSESLVEMSPRSVAAENARFMTRVYGWMTVGICVTGFISFKIGQDEQLAMQIASNRMLFWGLIIAQMGSVMVLSFLIKKMNSLMAGVLYLTYAALTGVTFSIIFLVYTQSSIAQVFALTGFAFGGLSAFGLVTKRDLGPVGAFCTMGLFGMVGYSLLSFIFPSMMEGGVAPKVYSVVGLIVFSGLTAYDTQKIKAMNILGNEGTDEDRKEAIFGALTLYLDFINLFLSMLRLFGNRRN